MSGKNDGFNRSFGYHYGVLAMMTGTARKTSHENKHLRNCDYFAIPILFAFYNVNDEPCNWISLSSVNRTKD